MIIHNISAGVNAIPGALPAGLISNDALKVVADTPKLVTPPSPTSEQLKNAVDSINKVMQQSGQSVEFSIDPGTKTPVVKMMDTETGKVIRQFPSEEVLAIAQSIDQFLSEHQLQQGMLLKQKA